MIKPDDLLQEAESLRQSAASMENSETRRRTVISRAYYAAYSHAVSHPDMAGYSHSGAKRGMHKDFIEHLSRSPNLATRQAGELLNRLHRSRIHADYRLNKNIRPDEDADCVEVASKVFAIL